MVTGMHGLRSGVMTNGQWVRPDYSAQKIATWPQRLSERGYETAAIGKMHFYPWMERMGFDYKSVTEDKRWPHIRDDYYHFLRRNGSRKYTGLEHKDYQKNKGAVISCNPWELSWDHFVGEEAASYLERLDGSAPFAMMVGFTGPHCPYDPNTEFVESIDEEKIPEPVEGNSKDCPGVKIKNHAANRQRWNGIELDGWTREQKRRVRRHYAGLVQQIDHEVGRILQVLENKGQLDNTLVIFSSDHGDYVGDHDMAGKGSFYEGSCHIPMIVCEPGRHSPAVCDDLVELTDITSTILVSAGCDLPNCLDSIPLPGIGVGRKNGTEFPQRDCVIGAVADGCMYFDGTWKYAKYATGEMVLFNLDEDPEESRNLVRDPAHVERLIACENALNTRYFDLMFAGHRDKVVDGDNSLWSDRAFGKEGYRRTYPQPW